MLRKVLKYDLLSFIKLWLILACASIPVALVGGFCARILMLEDSSNVYTPFAAIGMLVCIIAIVAFVIFTFIIPLQRIYKSMFTDEAYLTFTLPVNRETILFSKIITSAIFDLAVVVVGVIDLILFLTPVPLLEDGSGSMLGEMFATIGTLLSTLSTAIGVGWIILYIVIAILLAVIYTTCSKLLIIAIMSFVCTIATKHKVLIGILIYYGISTLLSFVSSTIISVLDIAVIAISANAHLFDTNALCLMIALLLTVAICVFTILATFEYKFTLHRITNKLNLA